MKAKILFTALFISLITFNGFGQEIDANGTGEDIRAIYTYGQFGINTKSPATLLHLNSDAPAIRLQNSSSYFDIQSLPDMFKILGGSFEALNTPTETG